MKASRNFAYSGIIKVLFYLSVALANLREMHRGLSGRKVERRADEKQHEGVRAAATRERRAGRLALHARRGEGTRSVRLRRLRVSSPCQGVN